MYTPTEPGAVTEYATTQNNIRCKGCGTAINFYGPVGFCRTCGSPLCGKCLANTVQFTNVEQQKTGEYIVAYSSVTRETKANVVFCRNCHQSLNKNTAGYVKWVVGVCLGILFSVLAFLAYIHQMTPNVVCMSVGVTVLVLIVFLGVKMSERDDRIKPTCPSCGSDAMPIIKAQNPVAGYGQAPVPNYIRCPCGYSGPVAPLDGLWKYVETWGPDALAGTPYAAVARHSWNARRQFRRT